MALTTEVQALLLRIEANTELARRELKNMGGDFDRFTTRSEEVASAAEKTFEGFGQAATLAKASIIGFATGIGIEGVISFGRAVLTAADELDAAAEKAGVGVERYQTLKESFRSLEVEGEKVDAIFGRLTDTLGAVQGGTAAAGVVSVLDRMGITSRILNGEIDTTDELLDAIAGSAGKFSSQAEFTASVIDIVGKKLGVDLANAIKDGGVALKAGEKAFFEAGGVITDEYIKALADANEAVDAFTSQTKSQIVIWSAQALNSLQSVIDQVRGLARIYREEGIAGLFSASGTRATLSGTTEGRRGVLVQDVNAAFIKVQKSERAKARGGFFDQLGAGSDPALAQARADLREAEARLASFERENPIVAPAASAKATGVGTGAKPGAGTARAKLLSAAKAGKRELTPAELRANSDVSPGIDAVIGGLPGALVDLEAMAAAIDRVGGSAVDLSNVDILDIEALNVGVGLLEDASFAITSGLIGVENLGDALVNTFARAGAAILQSGLLNLLSGGTQGTSFGDAFKGLGSLFSGKGFAGGGRPPVGKFSMVGERGPELFMPSVPGTIIPNHMLGGGGTVKQSFDLRGAVVTEALYAQMQAIGAQAAMRGAIGGSQIAAQDSARRARRRL